jgi:gamma-glutamyltranspeptidase / glutathione hydrolase
MAGMPLTSTRPELAGTFGMVATTHWLASQTGMSVLERGGNAFDAAVAAGFVLQVVEPHLNGPGGDLPVVLWSEAEQQVSVVCGQGPAPMAATPEVFKDLGLDAVPGTGLLAATVPGAFGAWVQLLQRWGTWRLRDVLEPAIGYARDGAPVLPRVSATIDAMTPMFCQEWTTSGETYLVAGEAPSPWSRLRLTKLAETYERIVAEAEAAGADRDAQLDAAHAAWYRGFVAEAVDRFSRTTEWLDTSGERHGGLLTGDDLADWRPTVEPPARTTYRGVEICKTGAWGQGPVLLQQLRLLDGMSLPDDLPLEDPSWVHTVLECMKLAFADREAWYGDPGGAGVPLDDLFSESYTAGRRQLVDAGRCSVEQRPGAPGGRPPRLAQPLPAGLPGSGGANPTGLRKGPVAGIGEPTVTREPAVPSEPVAAVRDALPDSDVRMDGSIRGDTVHVDVVDRWGNMVSATPSGAWLQSSPVVPELGFPLGTRGQMFWLEQGLPSSLRPGARPRTTLSPSLALRDGRPWVAFGTPGGDQQDMWSLVFALRIIHGEPGPGMRLQETIDAPMFHSEHQPSSFYPRAAKPGRAVFEDRWPASTLEALRRLGHDIQVVDGWSQGRLSAVARDGEWLRAASNPRGAQGYAVGR